jgi:hypothetical protein
MKLKSVTLGAVAMLGMTATARAADAVMAPEPEAAEYVKVCDAFGSGYFYIPGSDTCLSINGYVWFEVGATNDRGVLAGDSSNYNLFAPGGWVADSRVRINFDLRSQTEYGLFKGQVRLQADWDPYKTSTSLSNGDGAVGVDQAWFSLGGLLMGYTESAWAADDNNAISSYGSHSWNGMWYGYQERGLIQYNFGGTKGLFGTISLEDDNRSYSYVPDIVGILGYQDAWGAVWAKGGYDHKIGTTDESGYGVEVGTQINMPNMPGSSLRLLGYYADSDNDYGTQGPTYGFGGLGNAEWSALASYYQQFNEKFGGSVAFQYFNGFYEPFSKVKRTTNKNGYSAEISLVWVPVKNFEVRTEIQYDKVDDLDGSTSGYLRFTRFF